jgi:hypothetical protein
VGQVRCACGGAVRGKRCVCVCARTCARALIMCARQHAARRCSFDVRRRRETIFPSWAATPLLRRELGLREGRSTHASHHPLPLCYIRRLGSSLASSVWCTGIGNCSFFLDPAGRKDEGREEVELEWKNMSNVDAEHRSVRATLRLGGGGGGMAMSQVCTQSSKK